MEHSQQRRNQHRCRQLGDVVRITGDSCQTVLWTKYTINISGINMQYTKYILQICLIYACHMKCVIYLDQSTHKSRTLAFFPRKRCWAMLKGQHTARMTPQYKSDSNLTVWKVCKLLPRLSETRQPVRIRFSWAELQTSPFARVWQHTQLVSQILGNPLCLIGRNCKRAWFLRKAYWNA